MPIGQTRDDMINTIVKSDISYNKLYDFYYRHREGDIDCDKCSNGTRGVWVKANSNNQRVQDMRSQYANFCPICGRDLRDVLPF